MSWWNIERMAQRLGIKPYDFDRARPSVFLVDGANDHRYDLMELLDKVMGEHLARWNSKIDRKTRFEDGKHLD